MDEYNPVNFVRCIVRKVHQVQNQAWYLQKLFVRSTVDTIIIED